MIRIENLPDEQLVLAEGFGKPLKVLIVRDGRLYGPPAGGNGGLRAAPSKWNLLHNPDHEIVAILVPCTPEVR